jgi:hypothetical protein
VMSLHNNVVLTTCSKNKTKFKNVRLSMVYTTKLLKRKLSGIKTGEFFVVVIFYNLWVREECVEEPGEQHGVQVNHNN